MNVQHAPKGDYFKVQGITHVDYKDVAILKRFLNANGRLMARTRTGLSALNQRKVARAVKRARQMGLLPFIQR